jgi:ribonuclease VapC
VNVVDTSAIVAILFGEPGSSDLEHALLAAPAVMSAVTRVELGMVIEAKKGPGGTQLLEELLERANVTLVDVDAGLAHDAVVSWRRFGSGRHSAALNFKGDVFSYALARRLGRPLLYAGDDFAKTDIAAT